MKTRIIYNPGSGVIARKPALLARAREFVAQRLPGAEIVPTDSRGHATDLARAAVAEGCGLVVAFGGDGTMNEVAQALTGTGVTLGLLPTGSGNGLARHLGIPLDFDAALALLAGGKTLEIDTGLADGRPFFVAAGLGFEAVLSRQFAGRKARGLTGYLVLGARAWWKYRPEGFAISHEGGSYVRKAFTLAVANCGQYGNNARIAPRARVDDGFLDLVTVPEVNVFRAAPMAWQLFGGTFDRRTDSLRLQSRRFTVQRAAPGPLHTDGEPHEAGAVVEFSVTPGGLRVLVPAHA